MSKDVIKMFKDVINLTFSLINKAVIGCITFENRYHLTPSIYKGKISLQKIYRVSAQVDQKSLNSMDMS